MPPKPIAARVSQYELAYRMQMSVPEAMDISKEPASIQKLYGTEPGKKTFSNNALLARRLVEHGTKFVEIELGGWDKIMETLKKRLEEQKERHEGGSKWIGTGGTSPFGAYGYNPQGIRIGQDKGRNKSAVKVWDQRQFKDYDDSLELGTRNIKVALRRLRRFAREGAEEELDLDDTIDKTARNAGVGAWAVPYGYNHGRDIREFAPDIVIDSLSELSGLID